MSHSPRTITLPTPLLLLYRLHASRLPPLSHACAAGLRAALAALGDPSIVLPPPPPPTRTSAATAARWRKPAEPAEPSSKPGAE